jgi:hypothetical protein
MSTCHAIVTFFHSSSQATAKLKEKTKARIGVALTVKQDVYTLLLLNLYLPQQK